MDLVAIGSLESEKECLESERECLEAKRSEKWEKKSRVRAFIFCVGA